MEAINFAVDVGRRLQRKQTGFIHYCRESDDLITHDTIPVLENALFALALFRTRLSDNVLEGKSIIEKLLPFEVNGNFPTYLHTYPQIGDTYLNLRLLPIFFWIVTDFGHVIGGLKQLLEACIERIIAHCNPQSNWAKFRLAAFEGKVGPLPQNLNEWGEGLVSLQMAEKRGANIEEALQAAFKLWHSELSLYIGPSSHRNQHGNLPEVTLFDLFMCEWQKRFSDRTSKLQTVHLQGALIRPLGYEPEFVSHPVPFIDFQPDHECPLFIAWDQHTFVLAKQHGDEVNFFFNHHPDHQIFVNGQKANVFQQNDLVEIRSKGLTIPFQFSAEDGRYTGHILRGNRPSQHFCVGENQYEAFDWQICIRTVVAGLSPITFKLLNHQIASERRESGVFLRQLVTS